MKRMIPCVIVFLILIPFMAEAQFSAAPRKFLDVILTPDHTDWVYETGQSAQVTVRVLKNHVPIDVEVAYEFGPEMLAAERSGTIELRGGTGRISMGTMHEPGFKTLKVKVSHEGYKYSDQIKVGYSPERIDPTVICPDDFDRFWAGTIAEIHPGSRKCKLKRLAEYCTLESEVYLLELPIDENHRMYGYLTKPSGWEKYPVLLIPPGAGVKPMTPTTYYSEQGFIALSIEIHGIDPTMDVVRYAEVNRMFGNYMFNGTESPELFYYRKVVAGCVRAIDFLCSLEEFDGRNVIVSGGSQGGALSMITAAIDERVTCVAAFYPAMCDMTGYLHGRAGGWPHYFSPSRLAAGETPVSETVVRTLSYYDVVNFASRIKVPGFCSWGYNDNTCPPTSVYSAVNQITAPKEVEITPVSGHWRFRETNDRAMEFIRKNLK